MTGLSRTITVKRCRHVFPIIIFLLILPGISGCGDQVAAEEKREIAVGDSKQSLNENQLITASERRTDTQRKSV